jgi:sugar-specific transcriptional regulator TrmB
MPSMRGEGERRGKSGADRPREDGSTRASARERQRQILQKELANEQELLAKAKTELAEQESVRNGDERNYARVIERLKPYQDSVETHEKNIDSLRRELGNLNRD